jgi:hypothetical protein
MSLGMLASSAHATDWDQAKVTLLAEQVADSANQVYRSILRTRTGANIGSGQARNYLQLKDTARLARNESRHLAKALQNGKGEAETFYVWQRLMSVVRDTRELARRMFIEAPTQEKMAHAGKLLADLAHFYQKTSP